MSISRRAALALGATLALPSIARAQSFKGKTLTVASWQDYGADDPATLKMFEAMTGATMTRTSILPQMTIFWRCCARAGRQDRRGAAQPRIRSTGRAAGSVPSDRHEQDHLMGRARAALQRRSLDPPGWRGLCGAMGAGGDLALRQPECPAHADKLGPCSGTRRTRPRRVLRRSQHAVMTAALYLGETRRSRIWRKSARLCSTSRPM